MLKVPICWERKCKWLLGVKQPKGTEVGEVAYCKAFPDGIPNDIAYGSNKHSTVQEGQVGNYIFEKINSVKRTV